MMITAPDNLHTKELESANQNFDLFRSFHRLDDPAYAIGEAVLKGDYYFSRFSLDLIPVDSVKITDRFARILREDASGMSSPELPAMSAFRSGAAPNPRCSPWPRRSPTAPGRTPSATGPEAVWYPDPGL